MVAERNQPDPVMTPGTGPQSQSLVLEACNISRAFPGVHALVDVDFDLRPSEVHALVGENGAGKSTLIKILSGLLQPDRGHIKVRGAPVRLLSPSAALQMGISAVHQEFNYCPDLNAVENMYLGRDLPVNRGRMIDWVAARRHAEGVLTNLGVSFDLQAPLRTLNATHRKLVEIARGLVSRADILILDEPTAALPKGEVEQFFRIIDRLRAMGVSIIYISHHLDEVFQIADRVTVLRDGRRIASRPIAELSSESLIKMMVGRVLDTLYPKQEVAIGEPILTVENLARGRTFSDISFQLRRGEILGLAGLIGAGRSELAQAIAGVYPAEQGVVRVNGQIQRVRNVVEGLKGGIAYLPEERQRQGLVLGMSVADNMTLPILQKLSLGLWLRQKEQLTLAEEYRQRFRIVCASLRQPIGRLSGGNQQKCVLAKWIMTRPSILILDEPTRGIDVGAKAEVHALMCTLAAQGVSIILISSELPELLAMSDRILVLHEGHITAEFQRGQYSQEAILWAATGQTAAADHKIEVQP